MCSSNKHQQNTQSFKANITVLKIQEYFVGFTKSLLYKNSRPHNSFIFKVQGYKAKKKKLLACPRPTDRVLSPDPKKVFKKFS